jgi:SecD/SecF fusion protein
MDRLKTEHPGRVAEIERVVQLYQAYQNERRPGSDPVDVKRLMRNAGVLEFRVAPRRPEMGSGPNFVTIPDRDRFIRLLQEEGYEGVLRRNLKYVWLPIHGDDRYPELVTSELLGRRYVLLHNTDGNVMLHDASRSGWQLTNVTRGFDQNNQPAAEFRLNTAGGSKMATLTAAHINDQMAIVLDDEVYSAPHIRSVIRGQGQITTGGDAADVEFIIKTLRSGSLPAKINPEPIIENTFDPSIGKTNRARGQMAAIYSLIAVAVFMLVYYLAAGAIADFALLLNIILILGGMSLLEAAFTLPGIAGVILTIGIAVDANVLIFERLREEQRRGQPAAITIKNAYSRAFSAIFDANVTTLITCLILGWIGTEEVRGFAVTLGLGVLASMFTAMVVTRWVFQLLLNTRLIKNRIKMLSLIGTPKINWIGKRHFFWGLSIALVAMGVASLVWQGSDVMGIEFSSGAEATIQLKLDGTVPGPDGQPRLADDALIRQRFIDQARELGPDGDVLASTAQVVTLVDADTASQFLTAFDVNEDGQVTGDEWQATGGNAEFFTLMTEGDDDGALSRADLNDRLPPRRFQVSTSEVNAELIRQVAADAFGAALERRVPIRQADFVANRRIDVLGARLGEDGWGRIALNADSPYRDELLDYEDGILFVLEDLQPTVSDADLQARIDDMRRQPDFQAQMSNASIVIGLTPAEEGYSSLAVLLRPADEALTETPQALSQFAESEKLLLSEALKREEAMAMRNFDASIAGEARGRAIMAIVLSWAAIVAYLWLRFGSIQWGLAAVICLVHDVIIVVGLVAASGWLHATTVGQWLGITSFKIDLPMVAAFLTVIGYSVNDTIVGFDRIRENRGKLTTVSAAIINKSINQTLARTLLTSGTTLIVVIIMYVWGGQSTVHGFSYALLMGVLFGTYSSVAVASPLLMGFKKALVAKVTGVDAAGETTRV